MECATRQGQLTRVRVKFQPVLRWMKLNVTLLLVSSIARGYIESWVSVCKWLSFRFFSQFQLLLWSSAACLLLTTLFVLITDFTWNSLCSFCVSVFEEMLRYGTEQSYYAKYLLAEKPLISTNFWVLKEFYNEAKPWFSAFFTIPSSAIGLLISSESFFKTAQLASWLLNCQCSQYLCLLAKIFPELSSCLLSKFANFLSNKFWQILKNFFCTICSRYKWPRIIGPKVTLQLMLSVQTVFVLTPRCSTHTQFIYYIGVR